MLQLLLLVALEGVGLTVFGACVMHRPAPSDGPVEEGPASRRTFVHDHDASIRMTIGRRDG
jgi:hypothetical protein